MFRVTRSLRIVAAALALAGAAQAQEVPEPALVLHVASIDGDERALIRDLIIPEAVARGGSPAVEEVRRTADLADGCVMMDRTALEALAEAIACGGGDGLSSAERLLRDALAPQVFSGDRAGLLSDRSDDLDDLQSLLEAWEEAAEAVEDAEAALDRAVDDYTAAADRLTRAAAAGDDAGVARAQDDLAEAGDGITEAAEARDAAAATEAEAAGAFFDALVKVMGEDEAQALYEALERELESGDAEDGTAEDGYRTPEDDGGEVSDACADAVADLLGEPQPSTTAPDPTGEPADTRYLGCFGDAGMLDVLTGCEVDREALVVPEEAPRGCLEETPAVIEVLTRDDLVTDPVPTEVLAPTPELVVQPMVAPLR